MQIAQLSEAESKNVIFLQKTSENNQHYSRNVVKVDLESPKNSYVHQIVCPHWCPV